MDDPGFLDKITTAGLGISSFIFSVAYHGYRNRIISAEQVKAAEDIPLGCELKKRLQDEPNHKIPYGAVQGIVVASGKTFSSKYAENRKGVIHQYTMKEHGSRRMQGFWSDTKRTVQEVLQVVEFCLRSGLHQDSYIYVTEAGSAQFIMDELTVTHDSYQPSQTSLFQKGIDRMFGEVVKGLHENERMLLLSTRILGLGEIFLENGEVKLGPGEGTKYILTKLGKKEVVKQLSSQASSFKVLMIISGLVGTGCLIYLLWKVSKVFKQWMHNRQMLAEIREWRENANAIPDSQNDSNDCIICLNNPKEVVILNCGHIALCRECANNLPSKICPVCRGEIVRFVRLYQA